MASSKLSRLMKLSWDIQRNKRYNRSKALTSAWAILLNEDITIHYLILRYNRNKRVNNRVRSQMSLFNQ